MMKWVYHIRKIFFLIPVSAILVLLIALAGCIGNGKVIVGNVTNVPPQIGTKIPMRVGLKLETAYVQLSHKSSPAAEPVFLGDALRSGAESLCRNLFRDVVIIEPRLSVRPEVDVFLTPHFEALNYDMVARKTFWMRFRLRWTVTAPDGREIYANTITGEATRKFPVTIMATTMAREWGELFTLSLKDQFCKAQHELLNSGWWQNPWWKGRSDDAAGVY